MADTFVEVSNSKERERHIISTAHVRDISSISAVPPSGKDRAYISIAFIVPPYY